MALEIEVEKENDKEYDEYEIKNCADMVLKAEEVKADSKKWPLVQKELEKRKSALDKLTGLDKMKAKAKSRISEMGSKKSE
jgi:hypothetical protein